MTDRRDHPHSPRRLPEAVYEQATEHFGEEELASLILAITAINAWNRIAISSGIPFTDD